ncbi:hypothetical protein HY637_01560 [Candidatus Woesearchaeota archaeon]|nr:hypothetical protein [Candidatus Woesearchaeota archaeon]
MKVKPDLMELLFGNALDEMIIAVMSGERSSSVPEARKILDSIHHQETKKIVASLRGQMARGVSEPKYDLFRDGFQRGSDLELYLQSENNSRSHGNAFFFSGTSYHNGIYHAVARLLEIAHPNYKWQDIRMGGYIIFKRADLLK